MIRHDDLDPRTTAPIPMTYPEWLAWASESRQSEWEDGRAIPFPPPTIRDARARMAVASLLGGFVAEHRLGALLLAPFEMRLPRSAREPDVVVVTPENMTRLTEERLVGPADLVVEVVSNDSGYRDRVTKFVEYAESGVREYWIGDPRPGRGTLEGFTLRQTGYDPIAPDPDGWIPSQVVTGFRFDPAWFGVEPPDLRAALQAVLPEYFGG